MPQTKPIILILGPTAGGKTDLAIELALRLPGEPVGGECVCADSMQIYRGMDIGTAKPTAAQRSRVPHHLLDLLDPDRDGFSVDTWLSMAEQAIEEIRGRGRFPIVVGGTNLYVQALLEGLFEGPPPDPDLRACLDTLEPAVLRRRLEIVDPPAAQRIHPNDRRRTIRALEVHELTGRRISDLQRQWFRGEPRRDVRIIGLDFSPDGINGRINARVRAMIEAGFVNEVRRLAAGSGGGSPGGPGRQAAEALGYRQILDHLAGRATLAEAIEQIKIGTRRFARQQRSWLRRFCTHPDATWIPADGLQTHSLANKALVIITGPPSDAAGTDGPGCISERLS